MLIERKRTEIHCFAHTVFEHSYESIAELDRSALARARESQNFIAQLAASHVGGFAGDEGLTRS